MASTAARWAAWEAAGSPVAPPIGAPPITFAGAESPMTVRVWLAFGADPDATPSTSWSWTDITDYVRGEVKIQRGRADGQTSVASQTASLRLANEDHRFSPRNADGPYYGLLRHNTPIKVTCDPGDGEHTRFLGVIPDWRPVWIATLWGEVQIVASGAWRQLSQSSAPLESAMVLTMRTRSRGWSGLYDPDAYWPMEAGQRATTLPSILGTAEAMRLTGPSGDTVTGPAGSADLVNLAAGGAKAVGTVPGATSDGTWMVEWVAQVPTLSAGDVSRIVRILTTGKVSSWTVSSAATGSGGLSVAYTTSTGSGTVSPTSEVPVADSVWRHYYLWVLQVAGNVEMYLFADDVEVASTTVASMTAGSVKSVTVNPAAATTLASHVGHVAVFQGTRVFSSLYTASTGYSGQESPLRWANVMGLLGKPYDAAHVFDRGPTMGPISTGTLAGVLAEIETADGGMIVEGLDGILHLFNSDRLTNQTVAMTIDYSQIATLDTVDDDQTIANYGVAVRSSGASGSSEVTTGRLGTDTIGRRERSVTVNLAADWQAPVWAGWITTVGTVDEYRYPTVEVSLAAHPELIPSWLGVDLGSRIQLSGMPSWLTPNTPDTIMWGYRETLSAVSWTVYPLLQPYWPWRTGVATDPVGFVDDNILYAAPTTCVLASTATTVDGTISVTTTGALWSTAADDYTPGIGITVGGEQMTVTAASGASNPQTLTVTRSVNGVVASHAADVDVAITYPGIAGL